MTKEATLTKIRFEDVRIEEVAPGGWVVCIGNEWFHEGPKDYLFFTHEEALRLMDRVRRVGFVDLTHWASLRPGYYDAAEAAAERAMMPEFN